MALSRRNGSRNSYGKRRRTRQKQSQSTSDENSSDSTSTTRCICGETHSMGLMVQCDRCEVWQHCSCMGLEQPDIPDQYYCEQCKPDNHKVTRLSNGKIKRQYVESPKKRMTLNSREASMSLEDVLAVRSALELYENPVKRKLQDTIDEELPSSTVSSVGHDESPLIQETKSKKRQTKQVEEVKRKYSKRVRPRSRTSTPIRDSSPVTPPSDEQDPSEENMPTIPFEQFSPESHAPSPLIKSRQPNARMSIGEMNKRATQILEYISSIQIEMATKHTDDDNDDDSDNISLSSASTVPLDDEELIDTNTQSSLQIMDILTRKLIQFQRKYGPRNHSFFESESDRITRSRETNNIMRNMMAH